MSQNGDGREIKKKITDTVMETPRIKIEELISPIEAIRVMATTIAVSNEMKEKIRNLGRAGDSYDDIIRRMYAAACENMLRSYLYDTSDSVPIDEAIQRARKQWPKS